MQVKRDKRQKVTSGGANFDNSTAANAAAGVLRSSANAAAKNINESSRGQAAVSNAAIDAINSGTGIMKAYANKGSAMAQESSKQAGAGVKMANLAVTMNSLHLPIMDRLADFSGQMMKLGTEQMIANAKKKAVIDVKNGNISDIGVSGIGVYSMAYQGAAEAAYISKTNQDTKDAAARIAQENSMNPEGFKTAWDSYKGETSKNAKKVNPYVDAVTGDVSDQFGDLGYQKIAGALSVFQYKQQQADNTAALADAENSFIAGKLNQTPEGENQAATSLIIRNNTLDNMVRNRQISERGRASLDLSFEKKLITAQTKSYFAAAEAAGNGAEFALGFKDNVKNNPEFLKFSPDEIDAMVNDMHKSFAAENKFAEDQIKRDDISEKKMNKFTTDTFDAAWLHGELTQDHVDSALENNVIDQAEYKFYSGKIMESGAAFTDSNTELWLVQNMATATEDDIMNIVDMTNEDKVSYIGKLRSYQSSEGGKWTSTVQGKESFNMIRTHFKILGSGFAAKVMGNAKSVEEYGKVQQAFVLEMEKLPADERESKAMHFAQAALDTFSAAGIAKKEENGSTNQASKKQKIQERIYSYQRRVGEVKSDSYLQGIAEFADDFGKTGTIDFRLVNEER